MNALCSKPDTKKDNFYELLGVSEDSSEDQILYEYRMKAREFHPDRNPGLSATLSFQKIQKAKEVLTDRNLRHLYNMWLSSDLSLSFEEYLKFEKKFQECMHWSSDVKDTPRMLVDASNIGSLRFIIYTYFHRSLFHK
uniref:J domain-containing protein n=1 Tax=Trichobilharzia regenti TaxID=157069 RepID=A0AA85JKG1_TRIRE|nr:unnamed protein product [Trichobilharzia regenti]